MKNTTHIEDALLSFHTFLSEFAQYFKTTKSLIQIQFKDISDMKLTIDEVLLFSYIIVEITDFSKMLDTKIYLEIN